LLPHGPSQRLAAFPEQPDHDRWFESGNFVWLSPVPILAMVNAVALWRAVMRRANIAPFLLALSFFALGFIGLMLGIWPNFILPPSLSIWDAAAPLASQKFVLVGALIMLPAVLGIRGGLFGVSGQSQIGRGVSLRAMCEPAPGAVSAVPCKVGRPGFEQCSDGLYDTIQDKCSREAAHGCLPRH
jgi:hypothetical protein